MARDRVDRAGGWGTTNRGRLDGSRTAGAGLQEQDCRSRTAGAGGAGDRVNRQMEMGTRG